MVLLQSCTYALNKRRMVSLCLMLLQQGTAQAANRTAEVEPFVTHLPCVC